MPEPGDYLSTPAVMKELGITRQRVAQLRQAGAFGECRYDAVARHWLHPATGVEAMRVWRTENYSPLTNPWPPWSQRDPKHRMPGSQRRDDGPAEL